MPVKHSQDLRTAEDITAWLARLNREWPQRGSIAAQIAGAVAALGQKRPLLVELACGSGYLAEWLLRTLPHMHYIGFDQSPTLLDYARQHLATLAGHEDWQAEIHLREADLNEEGWLDWLRQRHHLGHVDAVVSLQSLHDLGGEAEQRVAMRRTRSVLKPGGVFIYADLLLDPENPHRRRLPAYRHLDLLREAGFDPVNCIGQNGEFAIMSASFTDSTGSS